MLCRQVVVLQWQCQVGNSRRSVGACGSRQGVLKYGFSRDTRLCRARHKPDNAESRIMPSEVGERAVGVGFMQFYSALSERRQEGQHIVLRFESGRLRTCWLQFVERSFLRLQIGFEINVRGLDALMTKPECDYRDIHA